MEYRNRAPVTKPERTKRRRSQRPAGRQRQEQNRRKSMHGGQTNELGVTQGQNGEQGNSPLPQNNARFGQPGSE